MRIARRADYYTEKPPCAHGVLAVFHEHPVCRCGSIPSAILVCGWGGEQPRTDLGHRIGYE